MPANPFWLTINRINSENISMTFSKRAARYLSALLYIFFLFASQSSALPNAGFRDLTQAKVQWKTLERTPCLQVAEYRERQLLIHCVKIDLTTPGVKIQMLPQKRGSQDVSYVEDFCKKSGAILAFNTTPFYVHENGSEKKNTAAGLCLNDGKIFARPLGGYCALGFFGFEEGADPQNRRAKIFSSQTDKEIDGARYAAGGFWQILKGKRPIQFKELRDSRTAVGLDKSGKCLYVIAVEGENPATSSGLTYMECADFFLALGCDDAMEFDGGSSTQLCVNGRSVLSYKNYVKVPALIGFALEGE